MLYSEQMKEICDKLGVDRSECKDGLYSTFLQAISDACDNAGGGGVTIRNQNKTITENGTYKADSGYTGLGTVNVNVPSSGIVPSGIIDITENGSYDVTNFATALVEIAASGGDSGEVNQLDALIEGSITEVRSNATTVGNYAFYYVSKLATANLPAATGIGNNAFCRSGLTTADFPAATSIGNSAFYSCSAFKALILRSGTMATLANTTVLQSTRIASGTGYIYVPAALVDSYKAATNWSTYAAQFRALEDYTVDGTTTGELDSTKI